MPQAVDSNSTPASEIHPISLIEGLDRLAQALRACKAMMESMAETGRDLKDISGDASAILDCIIKQFELRKRRVARFIYMQIPPRMPDEIRPWPEVAGEKHASGVKSLRDRLIIEQMQQGFSVEQISQVLNLRVTAIKRIVEKLHTAEAAAQATD